jgi:Helix-turn-helix domain
MPPRPAATALDELAALVADRIRGAARREPHLTTEELAARLKLSARTVEDWRLDGKGPRYLPDPVRYRLADVEAWEESRLVKPAST